LRHAAGLTQQSLAERAGLAMRTVTLIEAGEDTRLSTLTAIAGVLDVTLEELFADDNPAA
jgi:transcriptional regulator with XRE-family HTH domain